MKITFDFQKETKGAVQFKEANLDTLDEPIIGTLYIRKSGLKKLGYKEIPSSVSVEVTHAS